MKKTDFRTKSIGTKVTEEEFARLEELAAAAGQSRAEWVRARLLAPASAGAGTEQVLAEVLALRSILLNLFFKVSQGQAVPAEEMKTIIERADSGKLEKALARLQPESVQ
jgi:hypothetical protein